ncbi:MAG TPA: hypothetical protein VEA63_09495, partial [Opitutus sp.]|nr:hypothetical protein [Opitutus sp.]
MRSSTSSPSSGYADLRTQIVASGIIEAADITDITPLSGGVSSDIVLVRCAGHAPFVVKRALGQLRVRDPWFADVSRNRIEQAWLAYAARLAPASVPRMLHRADTWFAMEYLGTELTPWKTELLAGRVDLRHAQRAGEFLGAIHRASWADPEAARVFATGRGFHELRIEPYL